MSDTDRSFGVTDALLLLMAVIWGVNFSVVKYGTLHLPAMVFASARVAIAAATLVLVVSFQRKPWPVRRDMLALVALGMLGNGIYQLLFVSGIVRTRVADAALIVASAPAFIAILSWMRGVERIHWRGALGIALSIAGVGVVILGNANTPHRQGSLLGAGLIVCAVLCWSITTVLLRPYVLRVDAMQLNTLSMLGGLIPLLAILPQFFDVSWNTLPVMTWPAIFYSGAISMGVAYMFWYRGVRVIGPTRTSIYGNLQPVVAILVAWAVLHEAPTAWQGAGAATIISGILLTRT